MNVLCELDLNKVESKQVCVGNQQTQSWPGVAASLITGEWQAAMTRVGPSVADSQRPAGTEMVQELEGAWALVYTERLESIWVLSPCRDVAQSNVEGLQTWPHTSIALQSSRVHQAQGGCPGPRTTCPWAGGQQAPPEDPSFSRNTPLAHAPSLSGHRDLGGRVEALEALGWDEKKN